MLNIDFYQNVIIQISTREGFGSGFYLAKYDLIITNNHVVGNNRKVVISGKSFEKIIGEVCFFDAIYDIAFIKPPEGVEFPSVALAKENSLKEGDVVVAIGHPFGFNYTTTQGIVSKIDRLQSGLKYIQVDAAINPGNSGGPLINQLGEVVGINSSKIMEAENIGFALPEIYLKEDLEEYQKHKGETAIRCTGCSNIVTQKNIIDEYCEFCGKEIKMPEDEEEEYKPVGVAALIEEIISKYVKDVKLARKGSNNWEIKRENATVNIGYTNTRFVVGDAKLCQLPKNNIREIYEFLLGENFELDSLTFSLNGQEVFLSFLIYDEDLTLETGTGIFKNIFEKADYYDNILINKFGAERILQDEI